MSGEVVEANFETCHTVLHAKLELANVLGMYVQRLFNQGGSVDNNHALADYQGQELHLVLSSVPALSPSEACKVLCENYGYSKKWDLSALSSWRETNKGGGTRLIVAVRMQR